MGLSIESVDEHTVQIERVVESQAQKGLPAEEGNISSNWLYLMTTTDPYLRDDLGKRERTEPYAEG